MGSESSKHAKRAVLGIDAAWTAHGTSGVGLLKEASEGWEFVAVEPSYKEFVRQAGLGKERASEPDLLLKAATQLLGTESVAGVAIDIPLARNPIVGRRYSDDEVSRCFGAQGCGTHSPSIGRPGLISTAIRESWEILGYPLMTTGSPLSDRSLIEVYPHPALIALLNSPFRIPYKVSKSHRNWPGTSVRTRIERVLNEMGAIVVALRREIHNLDFALPKANDVPTLASLKPIEDMLDALVCCWVGARYLEGEARPYGDHESAIWVP